MKKSTLWGIVVVIIVIIGIVWYGRDTTKKPVVTNTPAEVSTASTTVTAPVSVIENTKVTSKTSKFENAELGFSVNYPTAWEADNTNSGVTFIMPIDSAQVSTIAKLQADVNVITGNCSFPPVTTVKDRATIKVANSSVNTISMSNTVQGRNYFNRMYSLQKGNICYMFTFSSIALAPESKGLTGSNATQAQNNNKAIVNTSDADFTTMVKSFTFVQGAAGQDETKVSPVK